MSKGRLVATFKLAAIGGLLLLSAGTSRMMAQEEHSHPGVYPEHDQHAGTKSGALIRTVREATARFQNVNAAEAAGYYLQFGCVSGPDAGAMGMHFVNADLVGDGILDPTRPEILIYEPQPNGSLRLIGADFLVIADTWNASHSGTPELMGQLFHYFESPNRFGLPAFYTLHVWAWKESPTGAFVNWNTNVSCNAFSGETR